MLHRSNGTKVPKFLDSPNYPPDFKHVNPRKLAVRTVVLRHISNPNDWIVTFIRDGWKCRSYRCSLASAERVTNLVRDLRHRKVGNVAPELTGWTCYVDRAVCSPPREDDRPRDAFGVPYNTEVE